MKIYIRIIPIVLSALFFSTSCTKDFEEINTPRDLLLEDKVDVNLMLTRVMTYAIIRDGESGFGTIGNYSGMSVSGANRPFQEGESSGLWNDTYDNYGRNLADIIDICERRDLEDGEQSRTNKIAIARILKAWAFSRCTDVYGDIPYFESNLPIEDAVFKPKYDDQKSIYEDLFKELREAANQLDPDKESFDEADIMYEGDVVKWRKFANSLRLRLALRLRYVDEGMASENMSDLSLDDVITEREDDAVVYTITDYPEHTNPEYVDLVSRGFIVVKNAMAKTFLDILANNDDPRTKVFADTAKAEWPGDPDYPQYDYFGYRGLPLLGMSPPEYGYPYADESVSRWSDLLWVPNIERALFKASETYFALSEAALFGIKGSPEDAQGYYEKGLELAMEHTLEFYQRSEPQLADVIQLFDPEATSNEIAQRIAGKKITQEEIDAFLAESPVVELSGTSEEKLEQIINQKMIALFPQEQEAWSEYRRTGYPRILVGPDNDHLMGQIPRRFPYPTNEQNINGEQYQIALQNIGGQDNRLVRIWWDANPEPIKEHPEEVQWMAKPYR
ncbi:SusD/RagB family nutrient-binding outer membrane lipoprotein [Membranihabitans maritimus]|uniref:SusD/RagB family nutrient-binding outer membrane lipoprotein n=1 Tax=Membranihabitans maritimus TaxID=2904244 RepID=UPI001F3BFF20|nr:SusD/RagB family nutrient-binding outer membrane lipoprotein [Membranihabitans maritimus]